MKVIVLKVKGAANLDELAEVIQQGHTVEGGWQMPKDAAPGDLAVSYAGDPDQDYRACRVEGFLLAVGFSQRFVAARELISDEVSRTLTGERSH